MREVKLDSGAVLFVNAAPFSDAKALYQAVLAEARTMPVSAQTDMASVFFHLFCIGFSSKEVERCLWICLERCLYAPAKGPKGKIVPETFEPVEARNDFTKVCIEVAKDNIGPFVKDLSAVYAQVSALVVAESTRK